MDVTAKSAVKQGLWPPLLLDRSGRAVLGPGLIVTYALATGWILLLSLGLVGMGMVVGQGNNAVTLGIALYPLFMIMGLFRAGATLRRIEANHPWECYPEFYFPR
jgi:hypothetical protein